MLTLIRLAWRDRAATKHKDGPELPTKLLTNRFTRVGL
jgi:hypothetical protein